MEKFQTASLQNLTEHQWFIDILVRENVSSFLEVGSKFGGSLWRVANALPKGSRIVSVDWPKGDLSFKESQEPLERCVASLKTRGYDTHLFLGDSTAREIVEPVSALGPFDACFIDADHTLPYIEKDWKNYGQLCRIVAFHDIGWIDRPRPGKKRPIQVPQFWESIRHEFRHEEKKLEARDNGIGVLWRR